jgi:hypothetical protein
MRLPVLATMCALTAFPAFAQESVWRGWHAWPEWRAWQAWGDSPYRNFVQPRSLGASPFRPVAIDPFPQDTPAYRDDDEPGPWEEWYQWHVWPEWQEWPEWEEWHQWHVWVDWPEDWMFADDFQDGMQIAPIPVNVPLNVDILQEIGPEITFVMSAL